MAQPTNRTDEIPVVAPKKMSVDEKKGKYILLPTIPAMRIFVNEAEDEKPVIPSSLPPMTQPPMTLHQQIPMTTTMAAPQIQIPVMTTMPPLTSILDIPSTSAGLRTTFPMTTPSPMTTQMLPRPAPVMAPPQLSPFKPVIPSAPLVNNLSTEQSISSLILHQSVLQQQQQNSLQDFLGGQAGAPQAPVDVLSMLRLQQQAAQLAAALQAAGVQLPAAAQPPPPQPAQITLPMLQKTLPTLSTTGLLNNPFLQSPLFTNPV